MENYANDTSYPDSSHSSTRSREVDLDSTAAWDEQASSPNPTATVYSKVKLMCSYGGKIQPRTHDNQLSYTGGETKILVVDRGIKFAGLIGRLCWLCDGEVGFKYQLLGEDLDALISVTNDYDLEHMMHEYDRLCRSSSTSARLRLFLFPAHPPTVTPSGSFASSEGRGERLVEAHNSVQPQAAAPPPPPPPLAPPPANDMDFLFSLGKGVPNQVQPVAARAHSPNPDHELSGRVDDLIERHIQGLKRLQIGGQEEDLHRRRRNDNFDEGFSREYYMQKVPENLPMAKMPGGMPENFVGPGGGHSGAVPAPAPEQAMYMIQTQAGMYNASMERVPNTNTGPPNHGYYAVQRMPPEIYRNQQQPYGVVTQGGAQAMAPSQTAPSFPEGFGIVRSTAAGGVGVVDQGYTHVVYDNGMGRQIYYNSSGGVAASQYPTPSNFVFGSNSTSSSSSLFTSSTSSNSLFGPSTTSNISSSSSFGLATSAPSSTGFVFCEPQSRAPEFGSSTTSATSSSPFFSFNSGDQMTMTEDIMVEDRVQAGPAYTHSVPVLGQPMVQNPSPIPFMFGQTHPSAIGTVPYQFSGQQNQPGAQNTNPFQPSGNSLDFGSGGSSFSLGSGGSGYESCDRSGRRMIRVKHKPRRK